MILSGYSSLILDIRRVPIPDPVPPPREWVSWNPCRQSQASDSLRTTSSTESTNSAPGNTLNSSDTVLSLSLLTFSIVSFSPVVPSPTLPEYKVVWSKDCPECPGPHAVHGARLQVHQDSPGDILAPVSLVIVNIDPLQLEIRGACIAASRVNTMLIRYYLPELNK